MDIGDRPTDRRRTSAVGSTCEILTVVARGPLGEGIRQKVLAAVLARCLFSHGKTPECLTNVMIPPHVAVRIMAELDLKGDVQTPGSGVITGHDAATARYRRLQAALPELVAHVGFDFFTRHWTHCQNVGVRGAGTPAQWRRSEKGSGASAGPQDVLDWGVGI